MRLLLDSIDIKKLIGLRDRALLRLMGYTLARVGAVLTLKIEDYYVQSAAAGYGCTKKAAR
jgi:integrase/recombinase XerD